MTRLPVWAFLLFGGVAIVLGVMGIPNADHSVAKVVWAIVGIVGVASLVIGFRRRAAAV
jgi:uncharacterized membrane protein YtjA (UPF0391 family)